MKKSRFIAGFSAMALAISAMSISAFAAPEPTKIDQTTPEPKQGQAVITTTIEPTYIVTIPADTTVAFNALSTDFGSVELTQARLDPGKQIKVTVDTDTAVQVGKRRDSEPVILKIDAAKAHSDGVKFYKGNDKVVLADYIPPEYISM